MIKQKLMQAAKKARRKYLRELRRKSPVKVKATKERYWLKKAKELEDAYNKDGDCND